MDEQSILFSGLAALPILIPIAMAIRVYPSAGLPIRLFLFFLVAGLVTDLTMWFLIYNKSNSHLTSIFNIYSLLEALFFFWFVQRISEPGLLKTTARISLAATFPLWVATILIYPLFMSGDNSRSVPFDTMYEVTAAFLCGFALLRIAESEQGISSPNFWLLCGIFFYCFCTFSMMILLGTVISQKIWWMNNVINIVAYLLYAVGFLNARKSSMVQHPSEQ